jgi:hypothetical protein
MLKRRVLAGFLGLVLLLLLVPGLVGPALADDPPQAGLVIQFDDGRVVTRCVPVEGDEFTGADLLTSSGLNVIIDASTGMGITVCRVEGLGCDYPAERCFCRCMGGGTCRYWNYYYRDPGQSDWVYSPLGAVLRKIKPGSVEAWIWADGHTPPSKGLAFEAMCAPPAPTPAPAHTLVPPTAAPVSPTTAPVQALVPAQQPALEPTRTAVAPDSAPSSALATGTGEGPPAYLPFGVTLLALVVIGLLAWLRLR